MGISNAVKQKIISEFIKTPQGRQKLAASMTQPLRTRRDYTAVGRKTFLVEQLPDGALPIYDKDPDVTAYVVGEEGENISRCHQATSCNFSTVRDCIKSRDTFNPDQGASLRPH